MECGGGLACVRMWKTGLPCVYCAAGGGWMVEVAHIHCSSGRQPALGLGALTLAPLTRGGGWAPTPTNLTSSSRYGLTDPALWFHSQTSIGLIFSATTVACCCKEPSCSLTHLLRSWLLLRTDSATFCAYPFIRSCYMAFPPNIFHQNLFTNKISTTIFHQSQFSTCLLIV